MNRTIVIVALAGATLGCRADSRRVDVTMHPATVPAAPAERHVQLMVRDQTTSAMAQSWVGKKCRVQIRRDALGMAGSTLVPMSGGRWANQSSVTGVIADMSDQWVVIQTARGQVAIPQPSILVIELTE